MKGGMYLKFIFPQNYNFRSKIFGFIEYSAAILDVVWGILIYGFLNIIPANLNFKIFVFVILFFPAILFSIVGFNGENIINVFSYLFKYIVNTKVLLYKK